MQKSRALFLPSVEMSRGIVQAARPTHARCAACPPEVAGRRKSRFQARNRVAGSRTERGKLVFELSLEAARARIRSAGKGHINGRVTVTLGRWSNALGDP